MTPDGPEQEARAEIDAQLEAAGWIVQDRDAANVYAGPGVAIREFKMAQGHGYADYLLFVDQHTVGALEAGRRTGAGRGVSRRLTIFDPFV